MVADTLPSNGRISGFVAREWRKSAIPLSSFSEMLHFGNSRSIPEARHSCSRAEKDNCSLPRKGLRGQLVMEGEVGCQSVLQDLSWVPTFQQVNVRGFLLLSHANRTSKWSDQENYWWQTQMRKRNLMRCLWWLRLTQGLWTLSRVQL